VRIPSSATPAGAASLVVLGDSPVVDVVLWEAIARKGVRRIRRPGSLTSCYSWSRTLRCYVAFPPC
jgi:hypothetical protein